MLTENRWRQRPCSPAMNMALSASGRVPRESGARLWRTTLLARSSELYLPAHGWRERWMRLMGSQLSRQPGRRILRAAASRILRPMKSGNDLTAVRSFHGRCAGRYIKPPSRHSDYAAPVFAHCFPRWYQRRPLLVAVSRHLMPKLRLQDIMLLDHGGLDTRPSLL